MIGSGNGLPSSRPVTARISNRAATESAAVAEVHLGRDETASLSESSGSANVNVMWTGPSCARFGRPTVFVARVEHAFRAIVSDRHESAVTRSTRREPIEIHLVARHGSALAENEVSTNVPLSGSGDLLVLPDASG